MSVTAIHLLIHGRVQGVGYRAWTAARARQLGLSGWVRNRRDGTVEAVVSGSPEMVAQMLAECHQGPPVARVTRIVMDEWPETVGSHFEVKQTV